MTTKKERFRGPDFVNPHKPGEAIQTPWGIRTVKTIMAASVELHEAIPHKTDEGRERFWTTAQEIETWKD